MLPRLEQERELEHQLVRRLVIAVLIATPLSIAFWVGLMAWAVDLSGVGYPAALAMGAGVGVLAGLFWGGWAAFVSAAPALDEYDEDGERA